jgi:hypothetical protein
MTHAGYNRIIEPNIQSNMKLRNPNNSDQKHVSETHLSSLIITATQQQQQRRDMTVSTEAAGGWECDTSSNVRDENRPSQTLKVLATAQRERRLQ